MVCLWIASAMAQTNSEDGAKNAAESKGVTAPHNIIGVRVNGLRFWLYRVAAMASKYHVPRAV